MDSLTWGIIGLVAGLIVGGIVAYLIFSKRTHSPTVGQIKAENDRFKEEVNAHFVQTAELINELTDSYKKVFDHLSDGADRLVDSEALRERMPQVGHQEVRLRHIGAPRDYRASAPPSRATPSSAANPASDESKAPSKPSEPKASEKPEEPEKKAGPEGKDDK